MRRRHARLSLLVAPALVAALGPVGCGGDEPPTRARDGRVTVALDEFLYAPQALRAPSGELTFALSNRGRVGHTFRLRREGRLYVKVPTLKPGERERVSRRLEPGAYRFFCAIANHEELGMHGSLVVR